MKNIDTVYDVLFNRSTEKYADEKYVAEKLNIVARQARKISGNWNKTIPYLQTMFRLISDNEDSQPLYQWIKENYMNKEW